MVPTSAPLINRPHSCWIDILLIQLYTDKKIKCKTQVLTSSGCFFEKVVSSNDCLR